MPHRNDAEAAKLCADAREREAREARERLEGVRANARPPPPLMVNWMFVVLGAMALAAGGVVGLLAWMASAHRQGEARIEGLRLQSALEAEQAESRARQQSAWAVTSARVSAEQSEQFQREFNPTWRGTLESTSLPGVCAGEPCTLTGGVSDRDGLTRLHGLTLRCGERVVDHQRFDPPRVLTELRRGAVYGSDAQVYLLDFQYAEADGRSIVISTTQHTLSFTGRAGSGVSTRVFLRDVSEPCRGAYGRAVSVRPAAYAGYREGTARVTRVRGRAPVREGERCTVHVRPVWESSQNCRMAVRCGSTWLYGAGEMGYLNCTVRYAQAVAAVDPFTTAEGGDPRLRWEGPRVVVSDVTEAGAWAVTLVW